MKRRAGEAYLEGGRAYANGTKVGDNPHGEYEEKHWQWMQGWLDAAMAAKRKKVAKS